MNDRRLTDAQVTRALAAHLPDRANPGLQARILADASVTRQRRALPSILGLLSDPDPAERRRTLLLVAAMLVALLVATGAAVGAILEWQRREAVPDLSLERPDDLDVFVTNAYLGLLDLPPLKIVMSDGDVWYHDGSGTVRQDRGSPGENGVYWIWSRTRSVEVQAGRWVVSGPSDVDPRVEIVRSMACCGVTPECAAGWTYVGLEEVIGRPTHHLSCGFELWFDVEHGLPLRAISETAPPPSTASGPDPTAATNQSSVVSLEIGPQSAALFLENPDGLPVLTTEQQICAADDACDSPAPSLPTVAELVPPKADGSVEPVTDVSALVADVHKHYLGLPALTMVIEGSSSPPSSSTWRSRYLWDGHGRSRDESLVNGAWEVSWLHIDGRAYEFFAGRWHDYGPAGGDVQGYELPIGLPTTCEPGWAYRGVDVIADRPAHHLVCGLDEYWVDNGWQLVTRVQHTPDALSLTTSIEQVLEVTFEAHPADLFELPPAADVFCPRCPSPAP